MPVSSRKRRAVEEDDKSSSDSDDNVKRRTPAKKRTKFENPNEEFIQQAKEKRAAAAAKKAQNGNQVKVSPYKPPPKASARKAPAPVKSPDAATRGQPPSASKTTVTTTAMAYKRSAAKPAPARAPPRPSPAVAARPSPAVAARPPPSPKYSPQIALRHQQMPLSASPERAYRDPAVIEMSPPINGQVPKAKAAPKMDAVGKILVFLIIGLTGYFIYIVNLPTSIPRAINKNKCPEFGICEGQRLVECRPDNFLRVSDDSKCVLEDTAQARVQKMINVLNTWTSHSACYSLHSYAVAVLTDNGSIVSASDKSRSTELVEYKHRPLFSYSQLVGEFEGDVPYDLDLVQLAEKLQPGSLVLNYETGDVIIGLGPGVPLNVDLSCRIGKLVASAYTNLFSTAVNSLLWLFVNGWQATRFVYNTGKVIYENLSTKALGGFLALLLALGSMIRESFRQKQLQKERKFRNDVSSVNNLTTAYLQHHAYVQPMPVRSVVDSVRSDPRMDLSKARFEEVWPSVVRTLKVNRRVTESTRTGPKGVDEPYWLWVGGGAP